MKTINLELFKSKVIKLAKQATDDFCYDMHKDLKTSVNNYSLDEAEALINSIRISSNHLDDQITRIQKAQCVMAVLDATLYDDAPGNILFENEELIFDAMYSCYHWEEDELPF